MYISLMKSLKLMVYVDYAENIFLICILSNGFVNYL